MGLFGLDGIAGIYKPNCYDDDDDDHNDDDDDDDNDDD